MVKIPLIIDTDPGIDDAVAIGIALFSPQIDLRLISTVAGNVSIDNVTSNALKLLKFWNKEIPVAKGASKPLVERFVDAGHVHGVSGMDGYDFPEPDSRLLLPNHAVEAIRDTLIKSDEKITIMPIGPLTNIALLLSSYPEVKDKIKDIVLMGGATHRGNKGVYSEFNIATDPEAASIVFNSGLKIVVSTLEMGRKALITHDVAEKVRLLNRSGDMFYSLFKKYRSSYFNVGVTMYDSNALAYILRPDIYKVVHTFGDVELNGKYTRGATIFDLNGHLKKEPNLYVTTDVDSKLFEEWFIESIGRCL